MKIKQIDINSFGKINALKLDFKDDLTAIKEENGWGKSTLAAFIKVMFYGFDESKRDEVSNERKHFTPWSGGAYGGSIVFEVNGKEYKLTRTFGTRAKDDRFFLYDNRTNLESHDFTDPVGEEIFRLDSESFKRTIFINQNDVKTQSTDGINAKLGNLAGSTDDIDNYEKVADKLKDKINHLSPNSSKGELYKLKVDIDTIETALLRTSGIEEGIKKLSDNISDLKNKLTDNEKEEKQQEQALEAAAKTEALLSKKDIYETLENNLNERRKAKTAAEAVFKNGLPDEGKLQNVINDAASLRTMSMDIAGKKPSGEEMDIVAKYSACFSGGVPDKDTIEKFILKVNDVEKDERAYSALQFSEQEKADYERLSKKFAGREGLLSNLNTYISDFDEAKRIKDTLGYKETNLVNLKNQIDNSKQVSSSWLILLIAGIIIAAGGIFMISAVSKPAGIIMICIGAVLAVSGIAVKLSGNAKAKAVDTSAYDMAVKEIEEDKKFLSAAEDRISKLLNEFSVPYIFSSAASELQNLKNEYARFKDLIEKEADLRDDRLLEKIKTSKEEIDGFLMPYADITFGETDRKTNLQKISFAAQRYTDAKNKNDIYTKRSKEYEDKKAPVVKYIKDLGFVPGENPVDNLNEIRSHYEKYKDAETEYNAAESAVKKFESENDVAEIKAAQAVADSRTVVEIGDALRELKNRGERISDDINTYNSQLQELLEAQDELNGKREDLADKKEKYDYGMKRYTLLSRTKAFLEQSKASFMGKYSTPVADGFKKYYTLLEGKKGPDYSFNANMELMINDQGLNRNPLLYSSGSQDMIGICFRMGLIDAMYKSEKPVIIMDDPFTNLDKERIEGGKKLLDEIKKDHQVIYFTCHESRMP